jgi:hypothetical protein
MPRQSKEQTHAEVHAFALKEFDEIQSAQRDERMQCLEDRRFSAIAGAQWEGGLGDQFENKPRFEVNRTHLAVLRVVNEYRNNRITVDFTPKDGSPNDTLADTCDGLYRADERASTAVEAYDNAFAEAAAGGMGAWRLRACYEDEDDEDNDRQRVAMEPIHDADSTVFFNLDAKRQDKGDAKRCYVLTPYTHDAYKEEFDDDPATWSKDVQQTEFDWCTPDVVWVCEHYVVEQTTQMCYWFKGLALGDDEPNEKRVTQQEIDDDPELRGSLEARGFRLSRQKRIKERKVHKYLLSGSKVLEDCGYIAGREIPIIVTYGQREVIDGVERIMGHVRLAKDAQRLTNMLMSWLAEIAARFDVEKPIFTPEQMTGLGQMWVDDNIKKYPYLLARGIVDSDGKPVQTGPVGYTKAPTVPPAMAMLMEIAIQALKDMLGGQEAGEELQPNLSGKAVELIQQRLDMQVFIYMSNFARGMKRGGEVWQSMMRDIVVERDRKMKTIASDGSAGSVTVNQPMVGEDGEQYIENDISKATFDVDVDVGPSSSSKRAGAVRALSGLSSITQDPEMQQAINLVIAQNIEGEGMGDFNAWARAKAIRMGITKPTDEEKKELEQEQQAQANQKPDPQAAYLIAEAEKARAEVLLKEAQTEKARAEAAKTVVEIGTENVNQAIAVADALSPKPNGQ